MTIRSWVAVLALAACTAGVRGAERPNVVFMLADDLGRADCGFMGGTEIRTPNIDRLAAPGRAARRPLRAAGLQPDPRRP